MLNPVHTSSAHATNVCFNSTSTYRCALNAIATIGQFFKNNLVMASVITLGGICITGLVYYLKKTSDITSSQTDKETSDITSRQTDKETSDITSRAYNQSLTDEGTLFEKQITTWIQTQNLTDRQSKKIIIEIMTCYDATSRTAHSSDVKSSNRKSRVLNLTSCKLTSLPDCITKLSNLTLLEISNNNFTSFPDCIAKLPNLKYLFLSGNKLTSLPDCITELSNLEKLYLRNNQLKTLPNCIGSLSTLKHLPLTGNSELDWNTVPEKFRVNFLKTSE